MKRILLTTEMTELNHQGFDEILSEPLEQIAGRYQAIFPADHLTDMPHVSPDLNVAFLTTDLASFERLKKIDLPGDLLFQPSPAARLDMMKRERKTLVVSHSLDVGTVLTEMHISEVTGGSGVDAAFRDDFIGRATMYDMAAGDPLDFGFVSEDPVGEAS